MFFNSPLPLSNKREPTCTQVETQAGTCREDSNKPPDLQEPEEDQTEGGEVEPKYATCNQTLIT